MAAPNATTMARATAAGKEGTTAIIGLWVPMVVFAHAFAAFWLLKTWTLNRPSSRRKARPSASSKGAAVKSAASLNLGRITSVKAAAKAAAAGGGGGGGGAHAGDAAGGLAANDQADMAFASAFATAPVGGGLESDSEAGADTPRTGSQGRASHHELFEALTKAETMRPIGRSLSLVVSPIALEWRALGCSYPTATGVKEVLVDVWGTASAGEMHALLGPSGAGKSTFMDMLALRKSVGNLTGRVLVNGKPATKKFVRKTAYVPQEDNFVPTMTTWETMAFYADIILPGSWDAKRRRVRISEVLQEMGLAHAHTTIVGGTLPGGLMMRGLSGGERKRLAIGVGILAAPSVLYLDEPTSGLDSFAALTVMGYMKRMALEQSQIVIASIHQPRSAIWQMFDAVTLLASGRLMFTGRRDDLTPWFGGLGYAYDPGMAGVASDWALDLVAIGFAKPARYYGNTISSREQLLSASAAFKKHYLSQTGLRDEGPAAAEAEVPSTAPAAAPAAQAGGGAGPVAEGKEGDPLSDAEAGRIASAAASTVRMGRQSSTATSAAGDGPDDGFGARAAMYVRQFQTLLGRELLSITRNPFDVAGRTLTFVFVGMLMGVLYYGLPFDAGSVRNRLNLMFVALSFYCLMPYISMGLYTADKKFYLSDASSQLYRPGTYYLAKIVALTPFQIVCACVFGFTVYGMAGLRHGAVPVLKSGLINTLMYLIASQVLHCCAVVAPNQDVAFMLSILWTAIQLLLSGFFINFIEVFNYWITYLRFISAAYFSFEASCINEFSATYLACSQPGQELGAGELNFMFKAFPNTSNQQRNQVAFFFNNPSPDCVFDTRQVLAYFRFTRPYWESVVILFSYLIAMHILTFVALLLAARRERR